jgi:alpha-L-fucosidase 2
MKQLSGWLDPEGVALKWFIIFFLIQFRFVVIGQDMSPHDLHFFSMPQCWDEGIPLGNGMLGALVWQKDSNLRISLDRADLWDLRPVKEFSLPQFSFKWVKEQVDKKTYDSVQHLFDLPYERDPAPTKIPAGALEFAIGSLGQVKAIHLSLENAICIVKWMNGAELKVFIDANEPVGRFRFEDLSEGIPVNLKTPNYSGKTGDSVNTSVSGQDLQRLGYPEGKVETLPGSIYYQQKGWGDFAYEIAVMWKKVDSKTIEGAWSITSKNTQYSGDKSAWSLAHDAIETSFSEALNIHSQWWKIFWSKSSIHLPDSILENQWYRDIYKFGSASRKGAPPITLQAVWTADNGHLPPWKGDFHNDLNTQLSYWPGYSSNHLEESQIFTNWIWRNRGTAEKYTQAYFQTEGLNYPGVSTLTGEPMGGWIQYALSPTVSAWLAQHFYLQWKYSMDTAFLKEQAYPFVYKTALFMNDISVKDAKYRRLTLSSSPEFNDNSIKAWFNVITNFDLALIRNLYKMADEMASSLGKENDQLYWKKLLREWPGLSLSDHKSLTIAPGYPYKESHRHFSHLIAIHPLGLIDKSNGKKDFEIINASLADLDEKGADYWCGYSYAWLGNLEARAGNGEAAAEALKTFSTCFCLPNSFHVNGDQSGTGKSKFTYRPFTLEGNFAFAAGIQEMLLQSQDNIIKVFPAIPASWKDVSFTNLRAQGAFLVSAIKKDGILKEITIFSEKGGRLILQNPFGKQRIKKEGATLIKLRKANLLETETKPGDKITLTGMPKKKKN